MERGRGIQQFLLAFFWHNRPESAHSERNRSTWRSAMPRSAASAWAMGLPTSAAQCVAQVEDITKEPQRAQEYTEDEHLDMLLAASFVESPRALSSIWTSKPVTTGFHAGLPRSNAASSDEPAQLHRCEVERGAREAQEHGAVVFCRIEYPELEP
jgi:hypothetical protein